jgi:hypothetical protein
MMAVTKEQAEHQIQWLTDEEARAIFDEEARKVMGMSGEEFLRRYDAGEFDAVLDDSDYPALMRLVSLIPWGR